MFRNVVWVFAGKMEFATKKERFTVERPGATISFTKDGIKLDGVARTNLETSEKDKKITEKLQKDGTSQSVKTGVKVTATSFVVYFESGNAVNLQEISLSKPCIQWVSANEGSSAKGALPEYVKPAYLSGELPDKTVEFGENVRKGNVLSVEIAGQVKKCPLVTQEVGILSKGNQTTRIPILSYEDCPIFVDPSRDLVVLDDLAFKETFILKILGAEENVLQTSGRVPFPLGLAHQEILGLAANAQNCIWMFSDKGISFSAGGKKYTSQKEGAEICFTKEGIKCKDVTVAQSVGTQAETPEQTKQQVKQADAEILERIPIEPGALFDLRNQPKCSLRFVPATHLPEKFESEIRSFINWPKNYQPPKACLYTDDDKARIVADGMFYTKVPSSIGEGGGFRCIGKFLVDKCLNPFDGIWDGKKEGAIHTIIGNLKMFEYEFQSDEASPLVFRLTKSGYEYVEGKGVVIDLKTEKKYTFPK
jgi:hypothetical protein